MTSPLASLTAQAKRGQQRQQMNPSPGTETGPSNPIGRAGAIGFLAEKMIGGLAKKKKLATAQPQGLGQQSLGQSPLNKETL